MPLGFTPCFNFAKGLLFSLSTLCVRIPFPNLFPLHLEENKMLHCGKECIITAGHIASEPHPSPWRKWLLKHRADNQRRDNPISLTELRLCYATLHRTYAIKERISTRKLWGKEVKWRREHKATALAWRRVTLSNFWESRTVWKGGGKRAQQRRRLLQEEQMAQPKCGDLLHICMPCCGAVHVGFISSPLL